MMISAVVFDFDGTLTRPEGIDFSTIRREIRCPDGVPILEFVDQLDEIESRQHALTTLDRYELEAAITAEPNFMAEATVRQLMNMNIPIALLTRNSRDAIIRALLNFTRTTYEDFAVVITRDDKLPVKPSPEGIIEAARIMDIPLAEVLSVGDFVFDVEVAVNAGCQSAFLTNGKKSPHLKPDFQIETLDEVISLIRGASL